MKQFLLISGCPQYTWTPICIFRDLSAWAAWDSTLNYHGRGLPFILSLFSCSSSNPADHFSDQPWSWKFWGWFEFFIRGEGKEFRYTCKKDNCYIKGKDVFYGPGAHLKLGKSYNSYQNPVFWMWLGQYPAILTSRLVNNPYTYIACCIPLTEWQPTLTIPW